MTRDFVAALQSKGFALVSNDRGHCSLVLAGSDGDRSVRIAASSTSALIDVYGPDGEYTVTLNRAPDAVALAIVEAVLR